MKNIIYLIAVVLLFACVEKEAEITIEKRKFISILADLHIAGELVNKFREKDKDSVRQSYLSDISTIYQVDTSEINRNIKIIQKNPDLAFTIYQDVYKKLDSLGKPPIKLKEKNELDNKKEVDKIDNNPK